MGDAVSEPVIVALPDSLHWLPPPVLALWMVLVLAMEPLLVKVREALSPIKTLPVVLIAFVRAAAVTAAFPVMRKAEPLSMKKAVEDVDNDAADRLPLPLIVQSLATVNAFVLAPFKVFDPESVTVQLLITCKAGLLYDVQFTSFKVTLALTAAGSIYIPNSSFVPTSA